MTDGILIDGSGQIAAVVHGWQGRAAPNGQTFLAVASVAGVVAGQSAASFQAQEVAAAGLTITSTGGAVPTATWPADPDTQERLIKVATAVNMLGGFPGNAATWPVKDAAGTIHQLSLAQFRIIATALAAFGGQADLVAEGLSSSLPATSVTVA